MKKIVYILIMIFSISLHAATRGDIKIIEASEGIRYLSQKIVKDYLFLYTYPQKESIKIELIKSLDYLEEDIRVIATITKDGDTKDILEFLSYSKEQMKEILSEKKREENVALMLDYSETLLEGADAISNAHIYDFSEEERMLMTTKKIEYLLERITKYYVAFNIGFNTHNNKEQMNSTIVDLEKNLIKINTYKYTYSLESEKYEMNTIWKENKLYFEESEILFIPNLLIASIEYLEDIIHKIAIYHSKNQ